MKDLKQWIICNILTPTGKLFPCSSNIMWWKNRNIEDIYNKIQEITNFLQKDSSFSERIYCILNDINILPTCPYCGGILNYNIYRKKYTKGCSLSCSGRLANKQRKKSCLQKYGVECSLHNNVIKNKIKKTNLEKYGVENPFQSENIKKKIKQTNMKKYGTENPFQSEQIKNKIKKTNLEKYGVENPAHSKIIRKKIEETNIKKYGGTSPSNSKNIIEKTQRTCLERYDRKHLKQINISKESLDHLCDKNWLIDQHHIQKKTHIQIANELNVSQSTVDRAMKRYNIDTINYFYSVEEKEVSVYISSIYKDEIIENKKSYIGKELDIYLPNKKLAIEYDGLYWHSYNHTETIKEQQYHLYKTILCENKNIQLLHIFENEWIEKQEIVKSILASKLNYYKENIFARKCIIKELSSKEIRSFLDDNHIQGYVPSKINLGLFYKEELISLMTFSKPRFNKNYQYELLRFCNKKFTKVIGGASKLFKYFIKTYNPESIISYADRRYFNGNLYNTLGFSFLHETKPNYYYFEPNNNNLNSRIKFQKHKLSKILVNFDPQLTESQNMFNNGYRRIWDCGNLVFEYNS